MQACNLLDLKVLTQGMNHSVSFFVSFHTLAQKLDVACALPGGALALSYCFPT